MDCLQSLIQKPFVAGGVGGVQAVVAYERDPAILEDGQGTKIADKGEIRAEFQNLFQVMILAGLVDSQGGHASLKTKFTNLLEGFVIFDAPVEIHDDVVDV